MDDDFDKFFKSTFTKASNTMVFVFVLQLLIGLTVGVGALWVIYTLLSRLIEKM